MKSAFAPVAAALLLVSGAAAQLMINTPARVVVCQPVLLTWSGGTPPYFLSILPGGQPSATPLLDFGQVTGTSLTWTANLTAGLSIGLDLSDNTGALAQSAPFTIQSSSDTSCLTGGSSSSSSSTGGSTPTGTPSATGGVSTTPVVTTPTAPVTTPTSAAAGTTSTPSNAQSPSTTGQQTTTSPSATTTPSAAKGNVANAAFAGAFGIGAALLAIVV